MYENMTTENILKDMMSEFGADVRTDEGSLAWNACAKMAAELEAAYEELESLRKNLTPLTMDLEHLIDYSQQTSVTYNYATAAIVRGVFTQEIPSGTQFSCGDYTYTSGELIPDTTYNYYLTCDEEGTAPNSNLGDLELESYIDDYEGGEITEVLTAGTDDEDVEEFRQRILDSFDDKPFGGNRADYRSYIDDLDGVGGCKPKRRASGDNPWINVWIISDTFGIPSQSVVNAVQDAVDPEESSGEGDGMAPICHHAKIYAASSTSINVTTTITLDTGMVLEDVEQSIKNAIGAYLLSLRKEWEETEFGNMYVRLAQVEAKILSVNGVIDVSDTTLNGSAENVTLTYEYVPLLGEVTISV